MTILFDCNQFPLLNNLIPFHHIIVRMREPDCALLGNRADIAEGHDVGFAPTVGQIARRTMHNALVMYRNAAF